MPIVTPTDVMKITGMTNTDTNRDLLSENLPGYIDKVFEYTQNFFHIEGQSVSGYDISFDASAGTITKTSGGLITTGLEPTRFQAGLYVHTEDSILNDDFYLMSTVTDTVITVSTEDTLYDEDDGNFITLSLCKIPTWYKPAVARFMAAVLKKKYNVSAERIGNYNGIYNNELEILRALIPPRARRITGR